MLTAGIKLLNFKKKIDNKKIKKNFKIIINQKNEVINSLSKNYKNNYKKVKLNRFKKYLNFRVIGMGGSTLGTQTIYEFLRHKIKKNFFFEDNLQIRKNTTFAAMNI